jgi:hypothetical protein
LLLRFSTPIQSFNLLAFMRPSDSIRPKGENHG